MTSIEYSPFIKELRAWIASGEAISYHRSVNSFGGYLSADIFNEFCGFQLEQQYDIDDLNYDLATIQPMLDHTMLFVGNNKELYELLLDHVADTFQNPHLRAPRVWVIKGLQGSGKTVWLQLAFEGVLGNDNPRANGGHGGRGLFASFANSYQVLREKFGDPSFGRKIIVFDDEQEGGDVVKRAAAMRNWVTSNLRLLESKYSKGKYAEELAQLFILTNESNVVDLGGIDNRRYIIVQMDSSMIGKKPYFDKLFAMTKSPAFHINWFKYMMAQDLSRYSRYNPILPQTELMISQYIESRPAGPSYLFQRFMTSVTPDPIIHCVDKNCKGNSTQGPRHHISSKYPCPNAPHSLQLPPFLEPAF